MTYARSAADFFIIFGVGGRWDISNSTPHLSEPKCITCCQQPLIGCGNVPAPDWTESNTTVVGTSHTDIGKESRRVR